MAIETKEFMTTDGLGRMYGLHQPERDPHHHSSNRNAGSARPLLRRIRQ
jgi:hypothetical protein